MLFYQPAERVLAGEAAPAHTVDLGDFRMRRRALPAHAPSAG